jgi:hypothetical protein
VASDFGLCVLSLAHDMRRLDWLAGFGKGVLPFGCLSLA